MGPYMYGLVWTLLSPYGPDRSDRSLLDCMVSSGRSSGPTGNPKPNSTLLSNTLEPQRSYGLLGPVLSWTWVPFPWLRPGSRVGTWARPRSHDFKVFQHWQDRSQDPPFSGTTALKSIPTPGSVQQAYSHPTGHFLFCSKNIFAELWATCWALFP